MATIQNVNNGDTGLNARNKINANDNALNAEVSANTSALATRIPYAGGSFIGTSGAYNNPTGLNRATAFFATNALTTATITFANTVTAGSINRFIITTDLSINCTLTLSIPSKTVVYVNSNVLKSSATDRQHLVEAHCFGGQVFVVMTKLINDGSTGVDRFENLLDAFDFVGEALKFVRVDAAENALEPYDLFGSLNLWSNFNRFDRQVQINRFLTFGITDVKVGGTLVDNYGFAKSVISLNITSTSDLTVNSILAGIGIGDNNNLNRLLIFRNESENGHNIIINNEGTGLANNRFYLSSNLVILPRQSAIFIYRKETIGQNGWYLLSNSATGTSYTDQQAREAVLEVLPTFNAVLDFTKNTTIRHTVNGAIEFTLGANPSIGQKAIFYLVADGLNAPTFGAGFVEKFNNYDNTINKVNRCYFEYVGNNTVLYEITYV